MTVAKEKAPANYVPAAADVYKRHIQAQLLQLGLNLANLLALGAVFGKNLLSGVL